MNHADGASVNYLKCGATDGAYATIDFGATSNKSVDNYFAMQRQFTPRGPLINSEFYPGWLVLWGQKKSVLPSIDQIMQTADYMYQLGASFNFYMFHGGTNFGFWNGAEVLAAVTTSYDYSAPLNEAGDITPKYVAIRNWLASKLDWPYKPDKIPSNNSKIGYGKVKLKSVLPFGKRFWKSVLKDRNCRSTKYPISFEELEHPFGFVMYHTKLKFGGVNLTVPLLKDHGFVFINNRPQGAFVNIFGNYSKHWMHVEGAERGAHLCIIVENRGRQTIPTINDFKGILSNVTLDEKIIEDWRQCGLTTKLMTWIARQAYDSNHSDMNLIKL
ncbi:unnamed protein product [Thelazia callipaeda]|uniref:Glyco_hydro_35 domain-containing protein n=1 Tax=Thelazia callipaeda TaxID=103827 RepID=A0A0N5CT25_THECL|nr:unnamed protein product [Thelazia callipaeda]